MQKITSTAGLKNAIQILEARHAVNGQLLKEQFHLTYASFNPAKLIRSTLISSSPTMVDNIIGTLIGSVTGYISKKIIVGSSGNIFRKLIGSVLQLGVTNLVAQNPEVIKSAGQFIFHHVFRKKEMNSE